MYSCSCIPLLNYSLVHKFISLSNPGSRWKTEVFALYSAPLFSVSHFLLLPSYAIIIVEKTPFSRAGLIIHITHLTYGWPLIHNYQARPVISIFIYVVLYVIFKFQKQKLQNYKLMMYSAHCRQPGERPKPSRGGRKRVKEDREKRVWQDFS